jgi:LysM repeat protein
MESMRSTMTAFVLGLALAISGLFAPGALAQQVVVVRSGETLSEIADRYGISLSRLMQANGISDPDLVVVGQRISIPGRGGTTAPAGAARSSQPMAPYTVKSGETLSEIAARFNTSTERLMQANGISNPDLVMSGTRLQVPLLPAKQPSAPPPPSSLSGPTANRQAADHVVQAGESLSLIAERYGTSVERLAALNQIDDPGLLLVGTRLRLRGTPPTAKATTKPRPTATAPATTAKAPSTAAATRPTTQTSTAAATRPTTQTQTSTAAATRPTTQTSTAPTTATAPATTAKAPSTAAATRPATLSQTSAAASGVTPSSSGRTNSSTLAQRQNKPITPTLQANPASQTTQTNPAGGSSRLAQATNAVASSRGTSATISTTSRPTAAAPAVNTPTGTPNVSSSATSAGRTRLAARPAASTSSQGASSIARASEGDWRSYGPLQVDWSKLQPMGGSYVAPSVNNEGQTLYLAVNCTARKINVTSLSGQWKTWETPSKDFEHSLVRDVCQAKAS